MYILITAVKKETKKKADKIYAFFVGFITLKV